MTIASVLRVKYDLEEKNGEGNQPLFGTDGCGIQEVELLARVDDHVAVPLVGLRLPCAHTPPRAIRFNWQCL